jgi:hypothetical protein
MFGTVKEIRIQVWDSRITVTNGAVAILQKDTRGGNIFTNGIEEAKAINYFGMLDKATNTSPIFTLNRRYQQAYEYFENIKKPMIP